jgi:DNA-binding NarL/FixJ family response regulator
MNTWVSNPHRESSIPQSSPLAAGPVTALYLTVDLAEADYLVYEIHKIAPNLRLDVSPRILHALDRLKSGRHDVVLVHHRVARKDRGQLISHIREQKLPLPIILIFAPHEADPTYQMLKAGADERIVKGPTFVNELPTVIEKALARYESGIKSRVTPPPLWEEFNPNPAAPGKKQTEEGATKPPAAAAPAPGRRQRKGAEKRTSPRYEVHLPCRVQWQEASYDSCIHDLSEEGAFVETRAPAPAGTIITILLKMTSIEVPVKATVTHYGWYMTAERNFDGLGVQFGNVTREAGDLIKELINMSSATPAPKTALER